MLKANCENEREEHLLLSKAGSIFEKKACAIAIVKCRNEPDLKASTAYKVEGIALRKQVKVPFVAGTGMRQISANLFQLRKM